MRFPAVWTILQGRCARIRTRVDTLLVATIGGLLGLIATLAVKL